MQENLWSLQLRLDFSSLAVNPERSNSLLLKPLALKIARSHRCLKLAMALRLSSPPLNPHSLLYVGGGGRESQIPQIVSHSIKSLVSGREVHSKMGSLETMFKAWSTLMGREYLLFTALAYPSLELALILGFQGQFFLRRLYVVATYQGQALSQST